MKVRRLLLKDKDQMNRKGTGYQLDHRWFPSSIAVNLLEQTSITKPGENCGCNHPGDKHSLEEHMYTQARVSRKPRNSAVVEAT